MELHGIGKVRASGIIEYRNQNGSIQNIDELTNIGMTPKVVKKFFHENIENILENEEDE